jgi:ribosomal protein S18 acetylase RimI-like enzyme
MSLTMFSNFQPEDQASLITLWTECKLTRPWNDPAQDIAFAMANENATILIGKIDTKIIAAAMVGHDGHRGSLYYVAVHPDHQKQGLGKALMQAAEDWLKSKGVWKINVLVRDDNLAAAGFYKALGFEENEVVSLGKLLN